MTAFEGAFTSAARYAGVSGIAIVALSLILCIIGLRKFPSLTRLWAGGLFVLVVGSIVFVVFNENRPASPDPTVVTPPAPKRDVRPDYLRKAERWTWVDWTSNSNEPFVTRTELRDDSMTPRPDGVEAGRIWFFVVYSGPSNSQKAADEILNSPGYSHPDVAREVLSKWMSVDERLIPAGGKWSPSRTEVVDRPFTCTLVLPPIPDNEPYFVGVEEDHTFAQGASNLKFLNDFTRPDKFLVKFDPETLKTGGWSLLEVHPKQGPSGFKEISKNPDGSRIVELSILVPHDGRNRFGPVVLRPVLYTVSNDL